MRRGALLAAAAVVLAWDAAVAARLEVHVEPLQASALRLDALYTETAGVFSRGTARLGLGMSLGWGALQGAIALGRASSHTDFGLLDGPVVRIEFADTQAELRWRAPVGFAGWGAQVAAGLGRVVLRHHPERIAFTVGGETYEVALGETDAWTRHVAAEVLHEVRGNAWIALRTAWIFYALDVATPAGATRRDVRDLQAGVALRVRVH